MPIFELDEGRPVLVQPMQPTAGSFAPDSSALLAEHLTALLDEQLFSVRARHGDAPGPHLLALDAAGQPVVVEVVQLLDADSLVRALQHAGSATRLSRTELLRTYEGGADAFDTDFRTFRDRVPLTAAQPRPAVGARLLLVCAEVDPQIVDAMAFLRQPGRQVEVLQLGVVRGADGRRYVDVSPLVLHQPGRRAVEPASLRLLRSNDAFAEAMAYDAERSSRSRVPYRELTPPSGAPLAETADPRTPVAGTRAVSVDAEVARASAVGGGGPDELWRIPRPASMSDAPAARVERPWSAPVSTVRPHGGLDDAGAGRSVASGDPAQRRSVSPDHSAASRPVGSEPTAVRPAAGPVPARAARGPVTAPTPGPVLDPDPSTLSSFSANDDRLWSRAGDALPGPRALPELASLVKGRGAVATLVWFRERRGQRLVATLRHDGLIELPDGRVHASPDDAAADAANAEGTVDGWNAWRLGDGGPTLAEAAGVR